MSQETVKANSKRRNSDVDIEDSDSLSHSSKRSADSNNQPRINESFAQKTLRLSGSLPNLELPNNLEKTFIANQIVTLEINQKIHGNMTGKSDDANNSTYYIPTRNQFDVLSGNVNTNKKVTSNQLVKQKIKIPPITVVGANNFSKAVELLNKLEPRVEFTFKYMSIGTKIFMKKVEEYDKFKKCLKESNIEFFSHDAQSEKFDRFILSGIPRIPCEEIMESLKLYQVDPYEIREYAQKTKKFDDEGSYVVSFRQGDTKILNLNKMVINYTIPKWRLYIKATNNITQCRRCQGFGHGMRNCNMNFKCSNCGLDHPSDNCNSPVTKCANCKGDHNSTSQNCPKRKAFLEMRSRLAASNNKKPSKPTPAPRNNLKNFPEMPKPSSRNLNAVSNAQSSQVKTVNWSSLFNSNSSAISSSASNNKSQIYQPTAGTADKFKIEEIGPIMIEVITGLGRCHNKEQQLILMFEIATKYIYNAAP